MHGPGHGDSRTKTCLTIPSVVATSTTMLVPSMKRRCVGAHGFKVYMTTMSSSQKAFTCAGTPAAPMAVCSEAPKVSSDLLEDPGRSVITVSLSPTCSMRCARRPMWKRRREAPRRSIHETPASRSKASKSPSIRLRRQVPLNSGRRQPLSAPASTIAPSEFSASAACAAGARKRGEGGPPCRAKMRRTASPLRRAASTTISPPLR
mmetsp:Transcript_87169/g.251403  ORF Transcript_87169/g.251403 Transcript_87169/m.251403 type:complete len:206 (-) Transcript_87169:990-1607(-)